MGKRKSRKQKEKAHLRRQVEALKAELKAYKGEEKKPARRKKIVTEDSVKQDNGGQKIEVENGNVKKDLYKTLTASVVILIALSFFYKLNPYLTELGGFIKYGDYKSVSGWLFWKN